MSRKSLIRILYVCVIVLTLAFLKLFGTFVVNEIFIEKYNKNQYDIGMLKTVMLMNFPESYVAHYNLGNVYYGENRFDEAISEYQEALKTVTDDHVCDIRLNLGLAMLVKIDVDSSGIQDRLKEIMELLLEDSCAKENGGGRHTNAQRLYDEIKKILENGGESDNGGSNSSDGSKNDPDINEEELEQRLRRQAEESSYERNNDYTNGDNYEYYNGKTW